MAQRVCCAAVLLGAEHCGSIAASHTTWQSRVFANVLIVCVCVSASVSPRASVWCAYAFVCAFPCLCVSAFARSCCCASVRSCVCASVPLCVCAFMRSRVPTFALSGVRAFAHSRVCSFVRACVRASIHACILALVHAAVRVCVRAGGHACGRACMRVRTPGVSECGRAGAQAWMWVCMCVCVRVCGYMCMFFQCFCLCVCIVVHLCALAGVHVMASNLHAFAFVSVLCVDLSCAHLHAIPCNWCLPLPPKLLFTHLFCCGQEFRNKEKLRYTNLFIRALLRKSKKTLRRFIREV